MIRLVTGTPGSGKTLYCTHLLVQELIWTDRTIVTNIPILRKELLVYLESLPCKKGLEGKVIDLDERLVLLDIEESFEFFRYRSDGLILPSPPDLGADGRRLAKRDFELAFNDYVKPIFENDRTRVPVTYIMSEAHRFFATADWASVGRSANAYLTHHRHLHDEVIFDTQHYEQLAKQLRLLIAECWVMRNQSNEKFGPFRKRPCFVRRGYLSKPTGGLPFETARFNLDASGIASVYESTGALGDLGSRGPEQKRKISGLPWWCLYLFGFLAFALIVVGVVFLPRVIGAGLGGFIGGVSDGVTGEVLGVDPASVGGSGVDDAPVLLESGGHDGVPVVLSSRLYLVSYSVALNEVRAVLSDGTVLMSSDADFGGLDSRKKAVKYRGEWVYYRENT